jgi:hypothetical protein
VSTNPNYENERVKEAVERLHKVATPMVNDILSIAQAALQRAQASVPDIADAARDVSAAHADLLASSMNGRRPNT